MAFDTVECWPDSLPASVSPTSCLSLCACKGRARSSSTPTRCLVQPCCDDSWLFFCCSSGGWRPGSIPRQPNAGLCPAPLFDPWHGAALQLGNDAVCDLLIEAGARAPSLACLSAGGTLLSCMHRLSSARQSRHSPEAGWAVTRDRKGPSSKSDRIRRTGTKRRTRSESGGLRDAAAGLEGRAAHLAPPGKAQQEKNGAG